MAAMSVSRTSDEDQASYPRPFPATILLRNDWLLSLIGALLCRLGCGSRRPLDHALPGGLLGGAEVVRRMASHGPQRIPLANPNRSPKPRSVPLHDPSAKLKLPPG